MPIKNKITIVGPTHGALDRFFGDRVGGGV
jgi:hypothetical protein